MSLPDLTPEETLRCVQACAALRLPARRGGYFREYLAARLESQWPDLAAKIRQLSDEDLAQLYRYVRSRQSEY